MDYVRLPYVVEARQWQMNRHVDGVCQGHDQCQHRGPHVHTILGIVVPVESGDYIVEEPGRSLIVVNEKEFESNYISVNSGRGKAFLAERLLYDRSKRN